MEKTGKSGNILLLKKLVVSKCIKDPNFKKQFLENPKSTIEKEFNIQIPNELQIKATEETDRLLYFIIPSKSLIESGAAEKEFELSDEELKAVAGGFFDAGALARGYAHLTETTHERAIRGPQGRSG